MEKACTSPADLSKKLLVEVFRDIAAQSNMKLSNEHIKKIEHAVDYMVAEFSAQ